MVCPKGYQRTPWLDKSLQSRNWHTDIPRLFFIFHCYLSEVPSSLLSWFTMLNSSSIFSYITCLAKFWTVTQHSWFASIKGTKFSFWRVSTIFFLFSTPAIVRRCYFQALYSNNVCPTSLTTLLSQWVYIRSSYMPIWCRYPWNVLCPQSSAALDGRWVVHADA